MRGWLGGILFLALAGCAADGRVQAIAEGQHLPKGAQLTALDPGAIPVAAAGVEFEPEHARLPPSDGDVTDGFAVTPADIAEIWAGERLAPDGTGLPLRLVVSDAAVEARPVEGEFFAGAQIEYVANLRVRMEQGGELLGAAGAMTSVRVDADAGQAEVAQARVRLIDRLRESFDAAMTREAQARLPRGGPAAPTN